MTDLDTGPSSIRDDSICESSLHPTTPENRQWK